MGAEYRGDLMELDAARQEEEEEEEVDVLYEFLVGINWKMFLVRVEKVRR